MPAKDIYHDRARHALIKDGWRITHDPLTIKYKGLAVFVDLGAEKLVMDEQGERRIAVEIKMLSGSLTSEVERAAGQYNLYRFLLGRKGSRHELFLAVPRQTYESLLDQPLIEFITDQQISLLVFDAVTEEIVQWIK